MARNVKKLLEAERTSIVRFGRKMTDTGLTTGTGGNLSIFNAAEGLLAISPSGVAYDEMTPEDVPVLTKEGQIVEGAKRPSSELGFHLALYRKRPDIGSVVHTHSVYAATLACLHWEIPAVHYLVGFSGDKVPLAPYATYGTEALAENICRTIGNYQAVLLANHGLVTVGKTVLKAFEAAEEIEFTARIYYQTRCAGDPVILSGDEMRTVIEKFRTYGQKESG